MTIQFPNLNLNLRYVPKVFHIMNCEITLFGIMIAAGLLAGMAFIVMKAKRRNQNQDLYLAAFLAAVCGGLLGGRLAYAALHWDLYKSAPGMIANFRSGGMVLYGSLLGGILFAALFCRLVKRSFTEMADVLGMGFLLADVIGVWGNFFDRGCFGEYTESLFAMQLPLSAVRSGEVSSLIRENLVTVSEGTFIRVHPVFLYESVWCLLLLFLLLAFDRKKRFAGETFLLCLSGYGLGKMVTEYLRAEQIRIPGIPVSLTVLISAVLFAGCGITAAVRHSMNAKRAAARRLRREKIQEQQNLQEEPLSPEELRELTESLETVEKNRKL